MYKSIIFFIFLFNLINLIFGEKEVPKTHPKVVTPLGEIKGYYRYSQSGNVVEAYEGIPYALPPVKELRFQDPQKITKWVGELQAIRPAAPCIQYDHFPSVENEHLHGSEDCLYLNVYVPAREKNTSQLLPVIFYIHGGAFQYGAGFYYGPKYLLDKDVILVTINYRLGALGFLSTEDYVVPGNMGLKDQNMALKWVYDHIQSFGGDPKKITLTGTSAGGVSVHYHYLSPLSRGLFHNGISFSGTTLVCWAQTENSLEKAKKLGALMGCPTDDIKQMIECLRYRPVLPLVEAVLQFMPWRKNPFTPFGPVVDKHSRMPFIDKSPIEILDKGEAYDVPWVTGVTSEEGLYPVAEYFRDDILKELDNNWNEISNFLLDFNYTIPKTEHVLLAEKIREYYFKDLPINKMSLPKLIKLVGDRLFLIGAEKAARIQAKYNRSPVWLYYYSYRTNESLSDVVSKTTLNYGVSHGDDAYIVLETPYINPTKTPNDEAMKNDLVNLWVSFATNSVPTNEQVWKQINPNEESLSFLNISGPNEVYQVYDTNFGNRNFWNSIKFKENLLQKYNAKDEF